MFAVCALGSLALQGGPNNSTIVNNTVPAPPAKTIPVDDTPIAPENVTPPTETPIEEQMNVKEQAQLEDDADPIDDTPIEDVPEPIISEPPDPVITETPNVTQEKPPLKLDSSRLSSPRTTPTIVDVREPITSEPTGPVITEPPAVMQEKPTSQPINTGVKWCHTDDKQQYTGDYYEVTTGAHGEIYLGANNTNKKFILIPV